MAEHMAGWLHLRPFTALCSGIVCVGTAATLVVGSSASAATAATQAPQTGPRVICVATNHANDKLAVKMAHDIDTKLTGRVSTIGLEVTDPKTTITCTYHASTHFYAASAIKATILGALLRMAQEQNRSLTSRERSLAWLMITQSDNNAATALWNEIGMRRMQHFLNLVKMTETKLATAWGLSLLTAHDEILLLSVLSGPNRILNLNSRVYAQYLMSHVISSQRWGVPAGAPTTVRVDVKNGWLPYPVSNNWEINSIGFFTARHPLRVYQIVMLTHNNPTMAYGINTIEGAAQVIHHDLNPSAQSVIPPSVPNPTWGIPDEPIPPRPGS
jgi:Beta-lactamase enzyme family